MPSVEPPESHSAGVSGAGPKPKVVDLVLEAMEGRLDELAVACETLSLDGTWP